MQDSDKDDVKMLLTLEVALGKRDQAGWLEAQGGTASSQDEQCGKKNNCHSVSEA